MKPNLTDVLVQLQAGAVKITKDGISKKHLAAILAHESGVKYEHVYAVLNSLEKMGKPKIHKSNSDTPFTIQKAPKPNKPVKKKKTTTAELMDIRLF
jgi:hypothetical protein